MCTRGGSEDQACVQVTSRPITCNVWEQAMRVGCSRSLPRSQKASSMQTLYDVTTTRNLCMHMRNQRQNIATGEEMMPPRPINLEAPFVLQSVTFQECSSNSSICDQISCQHWRSLQHVSSMNTASLTVHPSRFFAGPSPTH
jgi:hypothetical protein